MAIDRQLPLPDIPKSLDPTLRDHLDSLYTRIRGWVSDTATHLGQFQGAPVSNQTPDPGHLLAFDGQNWVPMATAALSLAGAIDGANVTYLSPFPVPVVESVPQAQLSILTGTGLQFLRFVDGVPSAGQWTFTAPATITVGAPPNPGDALAFTVLVPLTEV